MSKDNKSNSKFLTQAAKGPESNNLEVENKSILSNDDEQYVNNQRFKSKQSKKEMKRFMFQKLISQQSINMMVVFLANYYSESVKMTQQDYQHNLPIISYCLYSRC